METVVRQEIKMMNKKITFGFVALLLTSFFALSFVSADAASTVTDTVSGGVRAVTAFFDAIKPLTDILFGKEILNVTAGTTSFVAVEFLLLIIVFALVYTVLDSVQFFSEHGWALTLVSVAASILSVRTLSDGMISGILLPYQALGIALTAALPFVIYFIFVEFKLGAPAGRYNPLLRRILWIFLAVIYLFIYWARKDQLGTYSWIYSVTALVAVVMCFVDGTIQGWLARGKGERLHANAKERLIAQYERDLWQVNDDFSKGIITRPNWERKVKALKKQIADVAKS